MLWSGICSVTIDLESSAHFYTQTLGLKEVKRTADSVELRGKGTIDFFSSCRKKSIQAE